MATRAGGITGHHRKETPAGLRSQQTWHRGFLRALSVARVSVRAAGRGHRSEHGVFHQLSRPLNAVPQGTWLFPSREAGVRSVGIKLLTAGCMAVLCQRACSSQAEGEEGGVTEQEGASGVFRRGEGAGNWMQPSERRRGSWSRAEDLATAGNHTSGLWDPRHRWHGHCLVIGGDSEPAASQEAGLALGPSDTGSLSVLSSSAA